MPDAPTDIATRSDLPVVTEVLLSPAESVDVIRNKAADAILASPAQAKTIANATIELLTSHDPRLIKAYSDAQLRKHGMWLGGVLAVASIAGGVALLVSSAPAVAGIALLCTGAACAGGTFAIITGATVEPQAFAEMIRAARGDKRKKERPR
jgi:hypothetical protein